IVSQDTDGLTTPFEAAMEWAIKADKPFFIGQRSLAILGSRPLKRKLIGITLAESAGNAATAVKECHLIIEAGQIIGRVTSISYSPTLKKYVGLAFITPDKTAEGTPFQIRVDDGRMIPGVVAPLPFYDPKSLRQTEAVD